MVTRYEQANVGVNFLLDLVQVAACELLHSLVVYMVGKSAQMVEGETSLPPMYKLHKRLFPVLLRLACDVDQVCAHLLSDFIVIVIVVVCMLGYCWENVTLTQKFFFHFKSKNMHVRQLSSSK